MTRRQEQRYRRLLKEGFLRWEARGFIDTKITQPAMRLLRKERRATLREYKKQGVSKAHLSRELAAFYKFEGYYKNRRYQPLSLFEVYLAKQQAIEAERTRELKAKGRREERAAKPEVDRGYPRRFQILIDCGFLAFEARILAAMAHVRSQNRNRTFRTHPWRAMMRTREDLVARLKAKGYSNREIRGIIRQWYRTGKVHDPYEFLRREYKPRPKPLLYRLIKSITPKRWTGQRRGVAFWD